MSPKFWIAVTLALIASLFLLIQNPISKEQSLIMQPSVTHASVLYPDIDARFLAQALHTRLPFTIPTSTRIAIVPHHLIAAREIASLFSALPKTRTLILISPDHFSQGKTSFTIPSHDLCTSGNTTSSCQAGHLDQARLATLLAHVPSLTMDDTPFTREHGIYTLLPFVKQTLSDPALIPIIVRVDAKPTELQNLSNELKRLIQQDPNALLVASIDMSHYQTQEVADFHDVLTQNVIQRKDTDLIPSLEIDSPGSMFIALQLAKDLDLSALIQSHTNSLVLGRAILDRESTSHIVATFSANTSSSVTPSVRTEFWHQIPRLTSEEDRLYRGFLSYHVFTAKGLPYFFGVVSQRDVISVYPFPLNKQRLLLTRKERIISIQHDKTKIIDWLKKTLHINNAKLIY